MDRLNEMATFIAVAEASSFTGGARRLGKPISSVSRIVGGLEARLGAQLLVRNTRKAVLTDRGREYLAHCKRILADVDEAEAALGRDVLTVSGRLRLTAPNVFGRMFAVSLAAGFARAHPEVQIDLSLTDRLVDLVGEGFDLAIRTAALGDSELIVRQAGAFRRIVCCSPGYLEQAGPIASLEDLRRLSCLVFTRLRPRAEWPLVGPDGVLRTTPVAGRISADNTEALQQAAIAGAGLILTPTWQVRADLAAGRLVQVLPEYATPSVPVYLLFPRTRLLSARVRTFVDAAAAALPAFLSGEAFRPSEGD